MSDAAQAEARNAYIRAAADAVLDKGAALVQVWTPLNAYFESRGFMQDRFVRARAADTDVIAAFSGLLEAVDGMGSAFDRLADARARAPRARPKASSGGLAFRSAEAMALAKKFVAQLDVLQASGAPRDLEAADTLAFELDYSLDALSEAIARARTGDRPRQRGLAARTRMAAGLAGILDQ